MEKIINIQTLQDVSGGCNIGDIHNLANFLQKRVTNIIQSACLTLRKTPNGEIVRGVGWQNGEPILIHGQYQDSGWYFAYDIKTGKFGFVNPNNIS